MSSFYQHSRNMSKDSCDSQDKMDEQEERNKIELWLKKIDKNLNTFTTEQFEQLRENVKIMVDGIPIIGRLDGNIDLGQINLDNIERVEIIEGPMSVSYGSDALGGVINLITKKSQVKTYNLLLSQQFETKGETKLS